MAYGPAPESASVANDFIEAHGKTFNLYINGQWKKPSSGKYFDSINPATKEKLANIAEANDADVDAAVAAAKKALPKWIEIGAHQRARYLYAVSYTHLTLPTILRV